MDVNKITLVRPTNTDKEIVIPIQMTWDFDGREDSLAYYEKDAVKKILNEEKDFETARFKYSGILDTKKNIVKTDLNYEFYFLPDGATINTAVWDNSYVTQGFTTKEVYLFANSFKKSFFKLDLYDSTNLKTQKNYVTLILPTQQGQTTASTVDFQVKNIKIPTFKLDYLGDLEGYFIYWLKNRKFLNINTFYMTAKFFDAKNGYFVKMMNTPQSAILGDKFSFPQSKYFYYKVVLNYNDYTYKIYDISGGGSILVGDETKPIKWYEYINP
jgi:hypothetical protein